MAEASQPTQFSDSNPYYRPPPFAVDGPARRIKPVIYSPLTRLTSHWFSLADAKCARYEKLWLQCAYQGSRKHMYERCIKQLEDLEECTYQNKQIERFKAIQTERRKQQNYSELPVRDIYWERHAV